MKLNKITVGSFLVAAACIGAVGCQKMEQPALGAYAVDANTPGGPLNFYAAFDGTSSDPLLNAVDSIRATFPTDNPLTMADGISGKSLQGENKKFVPYVKPNDWAVQAKSFTISFWEKRDGQTKNNAGTNGPEYIFSFKGTSGYSHWSGASMLVFMEGNNAAGAVKVMIVDKTMADNWFTWEGGNTIAGLLDNQWHHISLVYDATTSTMTLYKDGLANANTRTWTGHGPINIDNGTIGQFRVGSGPGTNIDTDDWLSSTWKGNIDQLRLYSKAMTAAEVKTLFDRKM